MGGTYLRKYGMYLDKILSDKVMKDDKAGFCFKFYINSIYIYIYIYFRKKFQIINYIQYDAPRSNETSYVYGQQFWYIH